MDNSDYFSVLVEQLGAPIASPKLLPYEQIEAALISLQAEVDVKGLADDEMQTLVDALTRSKHHRLATRAIRLLLCRGKIRRDVIELIASRFSSLSSDALRLSLVRWLVSVKDALFGTETVAALRGAYDIWFHYLQYERMLPTVCKLLHHITRRADVTAWRSREITRLLSKVEVKDELVVLAELYATYAPGWIRFPAKEGGSAELSGMTAFTRERVKRRFLRNPEPIWEEAARKLRELGVRFD